MILWSGRSRAYNLTGDNAPGYNLSKPLGPILL